MAYALFYALYWYNPNWLGRGDVRLVGVIGLVLGWLGLPYILVALLTGNLAGIAVAGVQIGLKVKTAKDHMPYGVYLAAGSVTAVLAGEPLAHLLATYRF